LLRCACNGMVGQRNQYQGVEGRRSRPSTPIPPWAPHHSAGRRLAESPLHIAAVETVHAPSLQRIARLPFHHLLHADDAAIADHLDQINSGGIG
jgi:hypothetical protein